MVKATSCFYLVILTHTSLWPLCLRGMTNLSETTRAASAALRKTVSILLRHRAAHALFLELGLRRRQPRNRHTEWRAAHVVEPGLIAELDARRVAAVLAADADLKVRSGTTSPGHAHLHELPHTLLIQGLEGVLFKDIVFGIVTDELARVVTAETEGCLREVIRSEREELRLFGDLIGNERSARQLDHGADHVIYLHTLFLHDLFGCFFDEVFLVLKLFFPAHDRHHNLGHDLLALLRKLAGGFNDGPGLHACDLGVDDAKAAATVP